MATRTAADLRVELHPDLTPLAHWLHAHHKSRVLLVCGRSSFKNSGAHELLDRALDGRVEIATYDQFTADPKLEELDDAIAFRDRARPDVLLAIGGGSSIDFAKVLAANFASSDACLSYLRGESQSLHAPLPVVAVPTTAGTGSEATRFAVVYHGTQKYSLEHPALLPAAYFLVPRLTYELSAYQTAATALDALCQSVEALWAVSSTEESADYSRAAIPIILQALPRVLSSGDHAARADLLRAAHLGGRAINIARTTAAHALSYRIAGLTGIAHGHAVALTLGAVARHIVQHLHECPPALGERFAFLCSAFGVDSPQGFPSAFERFVRDSGLETRLSALGIADAEARRDVVSSVNVQRLRNNPVPMSEADLLHVLESVS